MRPESADPAVDCGCAPTADEMRSFRKPFSRRGAIGLGVIGMATAGFLLASPAIAATSPSTTNYPSWDDVERARSNESNKAAEITRIEGLIQQLANDVAHKQAIAEQLGFEYQLAQEEFEDAAARADSLQEQADAEAARAEAASAKLGKLAAQQYRTGGDDTSLELFFSDSATSADDLLARLGTMDQLLAANRSVYAEAVGARDNAQNLSDQARVARDERDRLQQEAEAKMVAAQHAADEAQAALEAQAAHRETLEAQLAALKDTTATTIAQYQEGVEVRRREREERLRREREAAARKAREEEERRRKAAEEEDRRRREQAAQNNNSGGSSGGSSGGGGGGGGSSSGSGGSPAGQVQSSGWVRPASGWISGWFGARGGLCSNGYCTSSGHRGLDFSANCWSPIYAAASGRVVFAGFSGAWGNYIKVDHGGGITTGYAHISPGGYAVSNGQRVSAGQVIAYVGTTGASTGCHLHFEVYSGGVRIDPAPYLRARGISV